MPAGRRCCPWPAGGAWTSHSRYLHRSRAGAGGAGGAWTSLLALWVCVLVGTSPVQSMANSKAHGRSQLAFLLCLVSCSLASTLPTAALAGRHLVDSSDSSLLEVPRATQNHGLSKAIEKSPRNPPSGPSAGTHPEDLGPALAVPVLSQLPGQTIALSLQPSQQVRLKQVEVWEPTGGVLPLSAEIKKGGIQPPSGPSPGGNGAQPLSRSAGIEKGGVQPPSGPSPSGN